MIKKRIEKLKEQLRENEAILIFGDINRFYFTSFKSSDGVVVITKKSCWFMVDFRYYESARKNIKELKVVLYSNLYSEINEIFKNDKINKTFIETDVLTVEKIKSLRKNLCEVEISEDEKISRYIEKMRSIKNNFEIQSIKEAQQITDKTFEHILNYIKIGKTEIEIALELEFFMRKNGSEGKAFDIIAVSGKNSSLPHGVPTDKIIENGDFITMDFGAVVNGYCSDMTRTVAVGNVTEEQTQVYNTVLYAQKKAMELISANKECKLIDKTARDIIEKGNYKGCFGHGLGHSVGLEIHENPCFNTRDNTLLKKGMVLTVEPGIYIENKFGVRIEDMVYITENSYENLTKSPKNLIVL